MPPSRKRKEPLAEENDDTAPKKEREDPASANTSSTTTTGDSTSNSNSEDTGTDEEDDKDGTEASPTASANSGAKTKCLKCWRTARKDCAGSLCMRCCTDETCAVHREQKARAHWKEAVTMGTTEIQRAARIKKARRIPRGRFREEAFRYMNDTVVLWDLRSVLEPSPPEGPRLFQSQLASQSPSLAAPAEAKPDGSVSGSNAHSNAAASASAYQNDLRVREEILRRSRRKHSPRERAADRSTRTTTTPRRDYNGTKKRFRNLMEDLYQRSMGSI